MASARSGRETHWTLTPEPLADAMAWMSQCPPQRFDLVLLDPPFDAGLSEPALPLAAACVAEGGFVYLESGAVPQVLPPCLEPFRHLRAGAVHVTLLRRRYTAADSSRSPSS